MKNLRYEVEVVGHVQPFKWKVYKSGGNLTGRVAAGSGDAESMDEAIRLGRVSAEKSEHDRRHAATVERVALFEVDEKFHVIDPDRLDLENWPVAEPVRTLPSPEHIRRARLIEPFPYEPPAMEFED